MRRFCRSLLSPSSNHGPGRKGDVAAVVVAVEGRGDNFLE